MKHGVLLGCLLMVVMFFTSLKPNNETKLSIRIEGIKNKNGVILLAIYNNSKAFPMESQKAHTKLVLKITNYIVQTEVKNLPLGWYAVAVVHDENNNLILDKNLMGIPKEGYGISNNAGKLMRAPTWDEAKIQLNAANLQTSIQLKY
jgi:uncharacterized protein (DUF2141 family)